ncbi:acyl-CoA N-acyltransferase [Xylariomycetidae sp. FL0641]|nr:acyl-CoA N-acyltransferase [Xylariomycetidae sp. FL0641]
MVIQVSPLSEADIPGAVSAIQEAFADDPYNNWVFDKSKFSAQRNAASLGIRMRWLMRNGLVHVAREEGSPEVLGVACWLKPHPAGQPQSWSDWFEDWRLWLSQVGMNLYYGRGGLNVKRYYIWKEVQSKVQSAVWSDPRGYYFLNIMVVVPKTQGKGVGRLMMKLVTDQADAEGMGCYLESSRDVPNMQIYGRFGFSFAKELECNDDGTAIKLFTMVREPKAAPKDIST